MPTDDQLLQTKSSTFETGEPAKPVWTPVATVQTHAGTPLSLEDDFFAAPPAEIGAISTAQTTLTRAMRPWHWITRLLLVAGVAFAVTAALLIVFRHGIGKDVEGEALVVLIGVAVGAIVVLPLTRFAHVATFVGSAGVARYRLKGSRANLPQAEVFLFQDAVELRTSQTRHYHNGIYTGTNYAYKWTDGRGQRRFNLNGSYRSKQGTPKSNSPFYFATAAERAWSLCLLDRLNEQLEQLGYVEFHVNRADCVRVGHGFLEFVFGGQTSRITPPEIRELRVAQGQFTIKHKDARWFSNKGVFKFQYAQMANAKLFLLSLDRLLGYRFS